jgi:hypothetical protein
MTKGTRRRALAALAVGGALSLSCSTATVGVSQEPARGGQVPGWARTRMDPEYPQERYLLGLGMAVLGATPTEALDQATAQSRADIAKQIRSRVTQILRDSVREEDLRGQMSYQRISAVATQETTELDLEGVEVVRQWIGSHSVYVLSVLDRESAAARAEERIALPGDRSPGECRSAGGPGGAGASQRAHRRAGDAVRDSLRCDQVVAHAAPVAGADRRTVGAGPRACAFHHRDSGDGGRGAGRGADDLPEHRVVPGGAGVERAAACSSTPRARRPRRCGWEAG